MSDPRNSALTRLALGGVGSAAEVEAKERALTKLASDHLAGREIPLDLATVHAELETVASVELTSQRALSAVWRAAQILDTLDAAQEVAEPDPAPQEGEVDQWFPLDLWAILLQARGWLGRSLSAREERELERDYALIAEADSPARALDIYRRNHE